MSTRASPSQTALLALLVPQLQVLSDPQRAVAMAAYMKNKFDFLGIPTPLRRHASKEWIKTAATAPDLLGLARLCWALPQREYQYVAADMLGSHVKKLGVHQVPELLALAQEKSWWDTVDTLAGVVGDILLAQLSEHAKVQQCMDEALMHPNLWVRRIAVLHQLGWRQSTDTRRLFAYALAQADEPDFFIRKAIGWALRDYARHDPHAVAHFLQGQGRVLSPLSRREAAKHLPGLF